MLNSIAFHHQTHEIVIYKGVTPSQCRYLASYSKEYTHEEVVDRIYKLALKKGFHMRLNKKILKTLPLRYPEILI